MEFSETVQYQGVMAFENTLTVNLEYNTFKYNYVLEYGVLKMTKGVLTDTQSTYMYNAAAYGGVYYLNNVNAIIDQVIFSNNYAKYGGTMYIVDQANIEINDSLLTSSFALIRGGTIMI